MNKRPSWDEYFLGIMDAVSKRSTCDRGFAGCVITKDKRIIATGYSGSPTGLPHCDEAGHQMHEIINEDGSHSKHCIRTIHAEQNALVQAARFGIAVDGSTLYAKYMPCYVCSKLIINAGIVRVVCLRHYHAEEASIEVFTKAGIKLEILTEEKEIYSNQK